MAMTVDRVVVGAGAMGLATAAQLARRGLTVAVIEQFDLHHHLGASHGATRNFNNAYPSEDYLDLIDEARELYRELERESGRSLLEEKGLVTHGEAPRVANAHAALVARGAQVELISAEQAAARWPGMRFQNDVLVSQQAGVISSAETLIALEEVAKRHGAQFFTKHRVTSLTVDGDEQVTVTAIAESGEQLVVHAAGAVVTVGAWSSTLLDGLVELPELTVTEEHPAHFEIREQDATWPSFNHFATLEEIETRGGTTYGMLTPGEGVKVGFHTVGEEVDPDQRTFQPTEKKRAQLRAYVTEWFPGLDPDTAVEISCTYTSTASGDFVMDRVGPLTIGAGFSGHGFKFVPAIGRVLADASAGVQLPPERFRLATHASYDGEFTRGY